MWTSFLKRGKALFPWNGVSFSNICISKEEDNIMKIAVTTPTGHVGSAVTEFLLNYGSDIHVKVLGRRPDRMRSYLNRGAEMGIGSQDDAEYLIRETEGIQALFWVTPPGFGSDNVRAYQNRLGKAAAMTIRVNQIPRVVNLSSVGADMASGAGPVSGLHDIEELMNEVATDIMHLRPGFFYENLFFQLDAIREWGRITLPLSGTTQFPMIATRDIARVAAEKLINPGWTERNICELHGSADLCFDEVAEILSETLGRKIVYVQCDSREMRHHLLETGMSENAADAMLEMYESIEAGRMKSLQPRSPQTTTPTTLAEFVRETLLPQLTVPATR
jgi:uncharacterized protein YbjT (DUF2867 family)